MKLKKTLGTAKPCTAKLEGKFKESNILSLFTFKNVHPYICCTATKISRSQSKLKKGVSTLSQMPLLSITCLLFI